MIAFGSKNHLFLKNWFILTWIPRWALIFIDSNFSASKWYIFIYTLYSETNNAVEWKKDFKSQVIWFQIIQWTWNTASVQCTVYTDQFYLINWLSSYWRKYLINNTISLIKMSFLYSFLGLTVINVYSL